MKLITTLTVLLLTACQYEICPRENFVINLSQSTVPEEIIRPGVEVWNNYFGREIFTFSQTEGTVNFTLEPNGIPGNGFILFNYDEEGKISGCNIHIEEGPEDKMPLVVAHELGHCLSLEDEYNNNPPEHKDSIMGWGGTVIKNWHTEKIEGCWENG